MKNAWIVPVIVIALALITGGIISLIPEKEIVIVRADTIVINSTMAGSAPYSFQSIIEEYNINVDWSEDLKFYLNITKKDQEKMRYGEVESGEYDNAIFLFDAINWYYEKGDSKKEIELGVYRANYCKENNIRIIGINFLTRTNGVPNTDIWNEHDTYEVISVIAPYMDILIIHYSENIDNRYYDLAEKNNIELIIIRSASEIADCLKALGI